MKQRLFLKLLFSCLTVVLSPSFLLAQENVSITTKLKVKYNYVRFDSVFNADPSNPNDYYYVVGGNNEYGVCDIKGNEIVPIKYNWINLVKTFEPYGYFYRVNTDEQHNGVLDKNGNLLIKLKYDWIGVETALQDGYFGVKRNDNYGICNLTGKEIIPPIWKFVAGRNGFFEVYDGEVLGKGTKHGLFDSTGKQIFACEYEQIDGLNSWDSNGFLLPVKAGYYGLADSNGKFILNCEYSQISVYDSLDIVVVAKGGSKSKRGSLYIPHDAKWGITTLQGKMIVDEYDYIGKYGDGLFLCNKGGSVNENNENIEGGKFGYLDTRGNLVIPCIYDEASKFEDGIAQVSKYGLASILTNPLTGTTLQLVNGGTGSKVDSNIPQIGKNAENTFAFIFANENYNHLSGADFSINDGKVFKEYCHKTFGLPEKNIRYYEDATYGNIVSAVQKLKDIADVYDGDAKIIFYYSGLGTSDNGKERYLLPVDASLDALSTTGYRVQNLMQALNSLSTEMTLVILDAPFSGVDKFGNLLAKHRGVQISPKPVVAEGNTILCISSSMTETARSDKKYSHSLFTYALLEKIQASQGNCTIKESMDFAIQKVKRESLNVYDTSQTPEIKISEVKENNWQQIKW